MSDVQKSHLAEQDIGLTHPIEDHWVCLKIGYTPRHTPRPPEPPVIRATPSSKPQGRKSIVLVLSTTGGQKWAFWRYLWWI